MRMINRTIVEYIAIEWVSQAKSQRAFAIEHGIDEKTVRNIKYDKDYTISLETLVKICNARELHLWEFFGIIGK